MMDQSMTYRSIYVPVDNSPHSNRAIDRALALGRAFEARLTGCHVYAAKMHDYRFKQMEYTLPEEYLVESELARQRKIHDSLITMGLELISDCYLEDLDRRASEVGLACEKKMMDGKHAVEILRDVAGSDYDLVVLGALGIGRTRDSQLGSVCSRVAREAGRDTWVVKHVPAEGDPERDTILVGIDGSPQSFGALLTAVELAKRCGKRLEVVGVYDPYLHYAVFKGVVEVLTERAAKVFRFEEQNQLHEEIIDTGLAQIYQSHLEVAASVAREQGVEVTKTLLDGKAFQKVLDHARKVEPWVLVIGRVGVHSTEGEALGSNTENLLRLAPCDVLLTSRAYVPDLDLKAEESIHWTPEAEERMTRVPDMVKGIARTAILRLALEQGHSVVSSDLVTEAMERFMPKRSAGATEKLAEALALEKARREPVSVCRQCGLAAKTSDPEVCTVCGARDFEVVTPEMVAAIAELEGGVEEETTYDGRKLAWTQEAKKALRAIDDRYQRRRAKARIEKAAHGRRMDPVTLEFAQRFIEEETGVLYKPHAAAGNGAATGNGHAANGNGAGNGAGAAGRSAQAPSRDPDGAVTGAVERGRPIDPNGLAESGSDAGSASDDEDRGLAIVARDDKGNPLLSRREWTADAVARILRVPAGFMRDRTQARVEELAAERSAGTIDLALVEAGIEIGVQAMAEMIAQQEAGQAPVAAEPAETAGNGRAAAATSPGAPAGHRAGTAGDGRSAAETQAAGSCPFSGATTAEQARAAAAGGCPSARATARPAEDAAGEESRPGLALNEVGLMSELVRKRRELDGSRGG
jgi:nucleotide-binding universal stress UspA family protein